MNVRKILSLLLLSVSLCFAACNKDDEEINTIDPNSLAVGTIIFDLNGETVTTTEGVATRDGSTSYSFGALWTELTDQALIIRTLSLLVFDVEPILEQNYNLVWNECSGNINLPCGLFSYSTNEEEDVADYRSQSSDTFLKIDFQELGNDTGQKVIGTFEAKIGQIGGSSGERFEVTRGAFNVILQ